MPEFKLKVFAKVAEGAVVIDHPKHGKMICIYEREWSPIGDDYSFPFRTENRAAIEHVTEKVLVIKTVLDHSPSDDIGS